jgi:hypothetical protein
MTSHIFASFLLAEGLVVGVVAYVVFRRKSEWLALCQRTSGEVIEMKQKLGEGDTSGTIHPVIRYFAPNGEVLTFESKFGSSDWKVKAGDRLEILVNQSNPREAEISGFMPQWFVPIVLGVISFSSIIFAPIIYLFLKV